jgi:hypothetical protein
LIDANVERTGDVELVLARAWSAVVRVPTAGGDVWFSSWESSPRSSPAAARVRPVCAGRSTGWAPLAAPRDVAIALGDPVPAWLGLFDGVAAGTTTLGDA